MSANFFTDGNGTQIHNTLSLLFNNSKIHKQMKKDKKKCECIYKMRGFVHKTGITSIKHGYNCLSLNFIPTAQVTSLERCLSQCVFFCLFAGIVDIFHLKIEIPLERNMSQHLDAVAASI